MTVTVEVWVDVLCPWCYLAERRLIAAIQKVDDPGQVDLVWRSFELGPDLSRVPGPTAAAEMRDGTWWGDQASARIARIRALGAAEGLDLNLEAARPVNSFDAHRLVQLGARHGRAGQVLRGLLYAYHTEGRNIADLEVLRAVGQTAGLPDGDLRTVLAGDAYADAVRADERRAIELSVTGVPTIVTAGGTPTPNVQSVEALRSLLQRAIDG
ncbi:DsbA family protein [Parafrankia sp. EUN1f]|uniref:DsbA family oxidoreductase n=1 Tax=Parafrankia sp. EUN1f TaxID=102897 RepID=UPI0001C43FA9|nr:DsbA family oxidoreductase [Parafrankia sp. EUN1f]EFC79205.1 DSBA oxidoreductase [Parafrankia sp. EUN1f]